MAGVRRRPAALADLEDIWRYGAERFGVDTADAAVRRIDAAFHYLSGFPDIGVRRDDLAEGLRAHLVRGYPFFIFYMPLESGIDVVRVLHVRRDAPGAFGA